MKSAVTAILLLVLRLSFILRPALVRGAAYQAPTCSKACPVHIPRCKPDTLFSHATNCSLFYRLYGKKLLLKNCSKGLHFNSALKLCDLPRDAGCTNKTTNQCPGSDVCPMDQVVLMANMRDCNRFCRCEFGVATRGQCPKSLLFNAKIKMCDWPNNVVCEKGCKKLVNLKGGQWKSKSCTEKGGTLGDKCKLHCDKGFELSGSHTVTCTELGWNSTGGLNILPACKTPESAAKTFVNMINETLYGTDVGLLFVLDESSSVLTNQFEMEKTFVSALIDAFPLSKKRSAGVITFSSTADVDIELSENKNCAFQRKLRAIKRHSGGTYLRKALEKAISEIKSHAVHKKTLVFLLTDGESRDDPTSAANALKKNNHVVITIGVAKYKRSDLEKLASVNKKGAPMFYGISNFDVLNDVANHMKREYGSARSICN